MLRHWPDTETFDMIVEKNIREMLCIMAGLEYGTSLEEIDLTTAAEHVITLVLERRLG